MIDINKKRDRVRIFEERGEHYTQDDIPEWVREKLTWYVTDRGSEIGEAYKYLIHFGGAGKVIVAVDGNVHFNKRGYERIIEFAERRELMRQDYIERWREEVFGKKRTLKNPKN